MMANREDIEREIVNSTDRYVLTELPTSYGKTKIALDWMDNRLSGTDSPSILIAIPKLVLINNWKDEITKWEYDKYLPYIIFTTYISFPKRAGHYDVVILDECHHLSDRCIESLDTFIMDNVIMLSATVVFNKRMQLQIAFPNLRRFKVTAKEAIEEDVLPDPTIYLIPLELDIRNITEQIIFNPKKGGTPIVCDFKDRWKYKAQKTRKVIVRCTQKQYYLDLLKTISYYQNRMYNEKFKNLYLHKCGERLKWLSEKKTPIVQAFLNSLTLRRQRVLTFCGSIEQTEQLGRYCINSKNADSTENLDAFNNYQINHITACNMLDEGINLVDCRIGLYAMLNSSERIIKQRLGRILRHRNPVIIIPYFKDTRDEEIVMKMREDYNPELIKVIKSINELEL